MVQGIAHMQDGSTSGPVRRDFMNRSGFRVFSARVLSEQSTRGNDVVGLASTPK